MLTLLSDFGLQDASVAIAKGVLMQRVPDLPIVDISHEVRPFHTGQAAYLLSSAYRHFPPGTCHVVLFDLFAEPVHRLLLPEYEGHYFLSADNGLLPLAFGNIPSLTWQCLELQPTDNFNDWLHAAGRIISQLQSQQPEALNLQPYRLKPAPDSGNALIDAQGIKCEVVHIDHYENVITGITRQQLAAINNGKPFKLQFMNVEEVNEISDNYNDVRDGFKLCRFNNNNHLEISINHGKAASLFGLRLDGQLNDIKILFE